MVGSPHHTNRGTQQRSSDPPASRPSGQSVQGSQERSTGFSAPVISLPKGGAIRGELDPVTGELHGVVMGNMATTRGPLPPQP